MKTRGDQLLIQLRPSRVHHLVGSVQAPSDKTRQQGLSLGLSHHQSLLRWLSPAYFSHLADGDGPTSLVSPSRGPETSLVPGGCLIQGVWGAPRAQLSSQLQLGDQGSGELCIVWTEDSEEQTLRSSRRELLRGRMGRASYQRGAEMDEVWRGSRSR